MQHAQTKFRNVNGRGGLERFDRVTVNTTFFFCLLYLWISGHFSKQTHDCGGEQKGTFGMVMYYLFKNVLADIDESNEFVIIRYLLIYTTVSVTDDHCVLYLQYFSMLRFH